MRMYGDIEIDVSELEGLLDQMQNALAPEEFERLMYRTLKEVATRVKADVPREVQEKYLVTTGWIKGGLGAPKLYGSGGEMTAIIPMKGRRGLLGKIFKSSQRFAGKAARGKKRQRTGRVTANILTSGPSELPEKMPESYGPGKNKPFMRKGMVWTRRTKAPYPLAAVVDVTMPQTVTVQAREGVEEDIRRHAEERLVHNFTFMFGGR